MSVYSEQIRQAVRTIADWPKPGIEFSDITPPDARPKDFPHVN
jgi:adenine/guanine phosphoribosyltransferase-like PRPP-binding protein